MSGPPTGVVARRLTFRLALQLACAAALVAGLAGGVARELARGALERRLEAETSARAERAEQAWSDLAAEVERSLSRAEATLRRLEPAMLEALLTAAPGARDVAPRLMAVAGLEILDVLGPDGTVLSSGHWPERAGLPAGLTLPPGSGRPSVRRVDGPSGPVPVLLGTRELTVGSRGVWLVGGRTLDAGAMGRLADGDAVALVDEAGNAVASSARGAGLLEASGAPGQRWSAARIGLDEGLALVVGVDRAGIDAATRRVGRSMLIVVAGAALLAALAGVWVARRAARPVAELVRAVDAIAAGREDYTFTRQTEDEFEQLVTAFSRLHRSLELQREHSRAAERVAAWRDVARQVAHEIKNPLAPIRLTVENLVRARQRQPQAFDAMFEEGATTILEEVERLRRLVGEFSEFARLPLPRRESADLPALVDSTLALWAGEAGLEVRQARPALVPPLALDADQIARALSNVVANAVDAMRERPAPRRLDVSIELEDGWVAVAVADRGPGFDEEALRRLFEPYFTKKPGGTGLGLAITYRIVVEHGGLIRAENREGGGGRVVIRLPLDPAIPGDARS